MKIAVYSIALNEEHHVAAWAESACDADMLLIGDTGSTDGTIGTSTKEGKVKYVSLTIKPWRFDDARNALLAHIPADIDVCIALDMDERLQPGWREALESAWAQGIDRPAYHYVWSWAAPGVEGLTYHGDKIHARSGYKWRQPCHEHLTRYDGGTERREFVPGLVIHHHPDNTKSRGQYLPLLAMAVRENPHCDRSAHYYGRDLLFAGRMNEAKVELKRHLALPSAQWKPERAKSMRLLAVADCANAETWLKRAVKEDPRRECYAELAAFYGAAQRWEECLDAAHRGLAQTERQEDYLCEPEAWGMKMPHWGATAAFYLGRHDEAKALFDIALSLAVTDDEQQFLAEQSQWFAAQPDTTLS